MRLLFLLLLLTLFAVRTAFSQPNSTSTSPTKIHTRVDEKPSFPGGKVEMAAFINKRFQFKAEMLTNSRSDLRTLITVDVMSDGSIQNIRPQKKGVNTVLFEELKRIIALMPKWNPGKLKDENVNTQAIIPFRQLMLFPYGIRSRSDTLVCVNGRIDSAYCYKNPQIKPEEKEELPAYKHLLTEAFEFPTGYVGDSSFSNFYTFKGIVDETGKFVKPELIGGEYSPELDAMAFKALEKLPRYYPAEIDGYHVKSEYIIGFQAYHPTIRPNINQYKRQKHPHYTKGFGQLRRLIKKSFDHTLFPKKQLPCKDIYIEFDLAPKGKPVNITVLTGISAKIDAELIRIIKATEGWKRLKKTKALMRLKPIVHFRIDSRSLNPNFNPTLYGNNQNY